VPATPHHTPAGAAAAAAAAAAMDVPEVQLADTTPKKLWQDYVSQRQPVRGHRSCRCWVVTHTNMPPDRLSLHILQVVIHGVADCWSNFSDDTLLEKAVRPCCAVLR
jgi:hypothetical protein